jgi:hypothetical protein
MADGRVVCVYGYRQMPSGIRFRVSEDGGSSWGRETILRDDGGSWDVGYPRVIETFARKAARHVLHQSQGGPDPGERRRTSHRRDGVRALIRRQHLVAAAARLSSTHIKKGPPDGRAQ